MRRLIVGVVGGDDNLDGGKALGIEVTRRGWILLTGGEVLAKTEVEDKGEVKDAAMLGAHDFEQRGGKQRARLIGIIPSHTTSNKPEEWRAETAIWCPPRPYYRLFLRTGLPHFIRNVINGCTPDVLVAFGGGAGTLAEMAFALMTERKVYVHSGYKRLLDNVEKYFGENANKGLENRRRYLEIPLRCYPFEGWGPEKLLSRVKTFINDSNNSPLDFEDVAAAATTIAQKIHSASIQVKERTGFPGLPHEAGSVNRFHEYVSEMSAV
jgi:SLOG cluster4 family